MSWRVVGEHRRHSPKLPPKSAVFNMASSTAGRSQVKEDEKPIRRRHHVDLQYLAAYCMICVKCMSGRESAHATPRQLQRWSDQTGICSIQAPHRNTRFEAGENLRLVHLMIPCDVAASRKLKSCLRHDLSATKKKRGQRFHVYVFKLSVCSSVD